MGQVQGCGQPGRVLTDLVTGAMSQLASAFNPPAPGADHGGSQSQEQSSDEISTDDDKCPKACTPRGQGGCDRKRQCKSSGLEALSRAAQENGSVCQFRSVSSTLTSTPSDGICVTFDTEGVYSLRPEVSVVGGHVLEVKVFGEDYGGEALIASRRVPLDGMNQHEVTATLSGNTLWVRVPPMPEQQDEPVRRVIAVNYVQPDPDDDAEASDDEGQDGVHVAEELVLIPEAADPDVPCASEQGFSFDFGCNDATPDTAAPISFDFGCTEVTPAVADPDVRCASEQVSFCTEPKEQLTEEERHAQREMARQLMLAYEVEEVHDDDDDDDNSENGAD